MTIAPPDGVVTEAVLAGIGNHVAPEALHLFSLNHTNLGSDEFTGPGRLPPRPTGNGLKSTSYIK